MFGLEILDVVIGLTFVFLLLSLLASAINEYISAVLNLRGKELARGMGRLLDDLDEQHSLQNALDGVSTRVTTATSSLTEQLYNHRLIRPYATRKGWFGRFMGWVRGEKPKPRLPSYIPARTFALTLLDLLGIDKKEADLAALFPVPEGKTLAQAAAEAESAARAAADYAAALAKSEAGDKGKAATAALQRARGEKAAADTASSQAAADATAARSRAAQPGATPQDEEAAVKAEARAAEAAERAKAAGTAVAAATAATAEGAAKAAADARLHATRGRLAQVLAILKQQSTLDLTEQLKALGPVPNANMLPDALQVQVAGVIAGTQTQLQKLHDGVEVWFNNSMDRVSGAYKRNVQGWLFFIGLAIASCSNADTIDMWRRLAENDKVREAMAARAIASVTTLDSVVQRAGTDTITTPSPPAGSSSPADGVTGQTDGAVGQAGDGATRADFAQFSAQFRSAGQGSGDSTQPRGGAGQPGSDSAQIGAGQTPTPPDTMVNKKPPLTPADSALARVEAARARYQTARARLDSMELKLGWTRANLVAIGVLDTLKAKEDSLLRIANVRNPQDAAAVAEAGKSQWWYGVTLPPTRPGAFFGKLLGLLLTAIAISLGAPFWFDLLNKVISIRAAGRSPAERPKSPEGGPKRLAEHTPM